MSSESLSLALGLDVEVADEEHGDARQLLARLTLHGKAEMREGHGFALRRRLLLRLGLARRGALGDERETRRGVAEVVHERLRLPLVPEGTEVGADELVRPLELLVRDGRTSAEVHVQLETLAVVLGERPEAGQHVSVVAELVAKRIAKRGEVMLLGLEVHLLDEGVALAGTPLDLEPPPWKTCRNRRRSCRLRSLAARRTRCCCDEI